MCDVVVSGDDAWGGMLVVGGGLGVLVVVSGIYTVVVILFQVRDYTSWQYRDI